MTQPGARVPAIDIAEGDVLIVDGKPVRVLDEPETLHRGWSPFDEFELLLGMHVQHAIDEPAYLVMKPDSEVWVVDSGRCR